MRNVCVVVDDSTDPPHKIVSEHIINNAEKLDLKNKKLRTNLSNALLDITNIAKKIIQSN